VSFVLGIDIGIEDINVLMKRALAGKFTRKNNGGRFDVFVDGECMARALGLPSKDPYPHH